MLILLEIRKLKLKKIQDQSERKEKTNIGIIHYLKV